MKHDGLKILWALTPAMFVLLAIIFSAEVACYTMGTVFIIAIVGTIINVLYNDNVPGDLNNDGMFENRSQSRQQIICQNHLDREWHGADMGDELDAEVERRIATAFNPTNRATASLDETDKILGEIQVGCKELSAQQPPNVTINDAMRTTLELIRDADPATPITVLQEHAAKVLREIP